MQNTILKNIHLIFLYTALAMLSSCFSESGDDESGGGLFANHKAATNLFALIPPSNNTYADTDTIIITLHHSFSITVTGTPRILLDIGGSSVNANYVSGSGSQNLVFQYTVTSGNNDSNGISITPSVDLNGGTLTFLQDAVSTNANLVFSGVATPAVLVDTNVPNITLVNPPAFKTFLEGQFLQITVIFDESVDVVGTPQIQLSFNSGLVNMDYLSGTGTNTLIFRYSVQSLDLDLDGINVNSPTLLNIGSIKDISGNNANLVFTPPMTNLVLVDGQSPFVVGVSPPASKTYMATEFMQVTLNFNNPVDITGDPRVPFDLNGSPENFIYLSGTGTNAITFQYPILLGDKDLDGILIGSTIDLNGGSILDSGLDAAYLPFSSPLTPSVLVDAAPSDIELIVPPADSSNNEAAVLSFILDFDSVITVSGIPRVPITLDSGTAYANYISGSGSDNLVFQYTVVNGEFDADGITVQNTLELNGGTLTGQNTLAANLDITAAVGAINTTGILITAAAPVVTAVSPPSDQNYITAQNLDFSVSFSEVVNVVNLPRIQLTIGASTAYANYQSGTGSNTLIFRYTIAGPDLDADGIAIGNNSIDLNSTGTISNASLVAANLDMTAFIPSLVNVFVNNTPVTVTSVLVSADKTYLETENITFTVNTSENIDVVGTPRIAIDIGGTPKYADYLSGTGSSVLLFQYTVETLLSDVDGISATTPIDLNLGTLKSSTLVDLDLNFVAPVLTNVLVDSQAPIVAITSPLEASYINAANNTATFAVSGTCDEATRTVMIEVDGGAAANPIGFICDGTNFAGTIDTFALSEAPHTMVAKLTDTNVIEGVSTTINLIKNTIIPEVLTFSVPTNAWYTLAANLDFTITSAENIDVTGTPRIGIDIGGSTRYADYLSGSGTTSLIFQYSVEAALTDVDGISLNSTLIDLNLGSINDIAGNPLNLNLDTNMAIPNLAAVTVDSDIPLVSITSSADINGANQANYSISGTCSENGQNLAIFIGSINITPICIGGAWTSGSVDVTSIPDSPTVSITADHSDPAGNIAIQGTATVDKNVAMPTVAITNAPDITQANQTGYTVSGSCSENGRMVDVFIGSINIQPNCSGGFWTTGAQDVSALVDNASLLISADHDNALLTPATQATINIVKDTLAPTVTISSAAAIGTSNETSYLVSGTCSEDTRMVDVFVGSINIQPTCSSGSWSTGFVDVSALSDGTVAITADHDNSGLTAAVQALVNITKATSTPSVSSLSIPTTLTNEATLGWSISDPGGFTLNDHVINYKAKGSSTWLVFDDGVSTTANTSVTALLPSTVYEFRVAIVYDTSNQSAWSNIAEGTTQPDDPLFDSPHKAMNVGGATTTNVVAYYDNTKVFLNGSEIGSSPLSKGQVVNLVTSQFDVIDADAPIYTAGRKGSGANTSKGNITWNPTSWAGKTFNFNAIRSNPQTVDVFAIEATTVTIKSGSTVLATQTIPAGTGGTLTWSVYGSYQVVSTGTILAFHISGDSTGGKLQDPKPLLPAANEIIGIPSSSMRLTTNTNATNYNLIHSNSAVSSGSLNMATVVSVNPQGTSSQFNSNSLLISADQKVSGAAYADSNGNCAAPFLPTSLMRRNYAINAASDWVAFASKQAGTIQVRNAADSIVQTLTLTRSGANPNAPYKAYLSNPGSGYRFFATVPIAAWYQPNNDTGSADEDETILYGTDL
jgi:hypothetical protein